MKWGFTALHPRTDYLQAKAFGVIGGIREQDALRIYYITLLILTGYVTIKPPRFSNHPVPLLNLLGGEKCDRVNRK
ncbi:hypothetical protein DMA11_08445 [Marinilabiliaceae bacterium JC017]|nr:hypothetical protein DMA11_08445 [Marinilabiliaceae bacterium JC017]